MTRRILKPVAQRRLSVVGAPDRTVIVKIGRPRLDPDPTGDWMCAFEVDGIGDEPRTVDAHGLDALQALLNAFQGVRAVLDSSGLPLSWEGGEPGDTGIPRMVPLIFGRAFAREIEDYIERRLETFVKDAETRSKQ